jgi:hypothetical protein
MRRAAAFALGMVASARRLIEPAHEAAKRRAEWMAVSRGERLEPLQVPDAESGGAASGTAASSGFLQLNTNSRHEGTPNWGRDGLRGLDTAAYRAPL